MYEYNRLVSSKSKFGGSPLIHGKILHQHGVSNKTNEKKTARKIQTEISDFNRQWKQKKFVFFRYPVLILKEKF